MLRLRLSINFKEVASSMLQFFYLVYMNEGGYKIRNLAAVHFITFAVVEWVDACLPAGRFLQKKITEISCWIASGIVKMKKGCCCIAGV